MPFVHRATEQNLQDLLARARFALVTVAVDEGEPFMRGLDLYFRAAYPESFACALMRPTHATNRSFWRQHFGVESSRCGSPAEGIYLFERGALIGSRPRLSTTFRPYYGSEPPDEETQLVRERRERERVQAVVGNTRLSDAELRSLCSVIGDLEPLVKARLSSHANQDTRPREEESRGGSRGAGPSGDRASQSAGSRRKSGPRKAASSERGTNASDAVLEHYVVLGVDPAASDEAVRTAWLEQLKLNHPDKVSHLSSAIQRVAHEQTLVIQRAYEAILALRRRD